MIDLDSSVGLSVRKNWKEICRLIRNKRVTQTNKIQSSRRRCILPYYVKHFLSQQTSGYFCFDFQTCRTRIELSLLGDISNIAQLAADHYSVEYNFGCCYFRSLEKRPVLRSEGFAKPQHRKYSFSCALVRTVSRLHFIAIEMCRHFSLPGRAAFSGSFSIILVII